MKTTAPPLSRWLVKAAAIALLLLAAAPLLAQRRPVKAKPKPQETIEEDPRIAQMLQSVQQVVFIDSFVTSRGDYAARLPLSAECGSIVVKNGLGQYTNEMGDQRFLALRTDSVSHILQSDYIGQVWSKPTEVKGLGTAEANNPFLMPDGTTLYYAQKGTQSLGGFDIFATRYDADNATFLRAENIGFPFASTDADDLLYVIDEATQLGFFVTDRRQPQGKVCVYVFIPPTVRRSYNAQAYSEQQLRSLAAINSIRDTWQLTSRATIDLALQRLAQARKPAKAATAGAMVYNEEEEQAPANNQASLPAKGSVAASSGAAATASLPTLRQQAETLDAALTQLRNYYARATDDERLQLRPKIETSERELEALQLRIRQLTKEEHNRQHQGE